MVERGAEKLSTGLVTIVQVSKRAGKPKKEHQKSQSSFKALFIVEPDLASADAAELHAAHIRSKQDLLRDTLAESPTKADSFTEIFSTHPNIIKRLRTLQELNSNQAINS